MPHYMIFNSIQQGNRLAWANIVGVFQVAESGAAGADLACRAAAKRQGMVGTYFAVEGHPWGIALDEVEGVAELGREKSWHELERQRQELELEQLRRRRALPGAGPTAEENDRAYEQTVAELEELEAEGKHDDAESHGEISELEPPGPAAG